jgi:hypothetical protein
MKITTLQQHQKQEALDLALRVFMAFEAPDYNEEGIKTFNEFMANKEKTDALVMYGAYQGDRIWLEWVPQETAGAIFHYFLLTGNFMDRGLESNFDRDHTAKMPGTHHHRKFFALRCGNI